MIKGDWATQHLQVIRTLMERSAVYRRALAPIVSLTGCVGSVAAVVGAWGPFATPRRFVMYWVAVGLITFTGALIQVRRQALRDAEPFWSPPMRRVLQGMLPALVGGFMAGVPFLANDLQHFHWYGWLPPLWMLFYGCALTSAGFFMPRGIKLFGWIFVVTGCGFLLFEDWQTDRAPSFPVANGMMGLTFGGFHLAYGIYLYFTETNVASK